MKINTNIAALNAQHYMKMNNNSLQSSIEKLSSGLRINSAADDASGMTIANNLRSQANALGQAISNANDGINIMQVADNAIDEQMNILDTIKGKAAQAAQDGQSFDSRVALQKDITRLMEEYENIANTTSFNGKSLLSGSFSNQKFQIGAYSNQTINVDIGATNASKLGHVRTETTDSIAGVINGDLATLTFAGRGPNGTDAVLNSVVLGDEAGQGIGVLANEINKITDTTGVKASWTNTNSGTAAVAAGDVTGMTLNGVTIGDVGGVLDNDSDGRLTAAINAVSDQTGVTASVDTRGVMSLSSSDGRTINVANIGAVANIADDNYAGRLTLTATDGRDIDVTDGGAGHIDTSANENTINLSNVTQSFTDAQSEAGGAYNNDQDVRFGTGIGAGVTSREGAMMVMDIMDSAMKSLNSVRADIGSVTNQFQSTIDNISVTYTNIKASESQIRDVDFAEESAQYNKMNILAQASTYALSQANASANNVLRLLQ